MKNGIEACRLKGCGASKKAIANADSLLYSTWEDLAPEGREKTGRFERKLTKCMLAKGGNDFHE